MSQSALFRLRLGGTSFSDSPFSAFNSITSVACYYHYGTNMLSALHSGPSAATQVCLSMDRASAVWIPSVMSSGVSRSPPYRNTRRKVPRAFGTFFTNKIKIS